MSLTINQVTRLKGKGKWTKKLNNKKTDLKKTPKTLNQPQISGMCLKVIIRSPKKPNSAARKVAKIKLSTVVKPSDIKKGILKYTHKRKVIDAYIPGEGHNLKEHGMVLVRGGRIKDLPGVKFKCLRGKFDLAPVVQRRQARSKYGTPRIKKKI